MVRTKEKKPLLSIGVAGSMRQITTLEVNDNCYGKGLRFCLFGGKSREYVMDT